MNEKFLAARLSKRFSEIIIYSWYTLLYTLLAAATGLPHNQNKQRDYNLVRRTMVATPTREAKKWRRTADFTCMQPVSHWTLLKLIKKKKITFCLRCFYFAVAAGVRCGRKVHATRNCTINFHYIFCKRGSVFLATLESHILKKKTIHPYFCSWQYKHRLLQL